MNTPGYDFRQTRCETNSLGEYSKLLADVFKNESLSSVPALEWLYSANPAGQVVGFDAFQGPKLAAHYVTVPVVARYGSNMLKGLLSLNTATHPEHTGKGLFTKLAEQTYALAAQQGFAFVIGVANQNSTPGFIKKLGFEFVAPLEARIGLTHVRPQCLQDQYEFVLPKTQEFLSWRLSKPGRRYTLARTGRGRFVYAPTGYPGIHALMTSIDDSMEVPSLANSHPIFKLTLGIDRLATKKGLSIDIPASLRPSPLNLIFKSLKPDVKGLKGANFLFETIDFDAY
jgi:hypothetical protein